MRFTLPSLFGWIGLFSISILAGGQASAAMPTALATGHDHNCALTTAGGVECWGAGAFGQLGNGNKLNSSVPVAVNGLSSGVVQVTTGQTHSCALLSTGSVKCWGYNSHGQLGDGTTVANVNPVTVVGVSGAIALGSGNGHNCVVNSTGTVACWGTNTHGQLGDGSGTHRTVAVPVLGVSGAAGVVGGGSHSCVWLKSGAAQCWGINTSGQLGDSTLTNSKVRVNVTSLSNVRGMAGGPSHNCAYTTGGAAFCWGRNHEGQIGNGGISTQIYSSPTPVTGISSGVVAMAASRITSSSCARFSDGSARCWGANTSGQLGVGDMLNKFTPAVVTIVSGITDLVVGANSSCAIVSGGAKCWGANTLGQHGAGNTVPISFAQDVIGLFGSAPPQNPNPLSPVTSATPSYTWQAIPGASSYRLRINGVTTVHTDVAAGCPNGIGLCKITGPSLTPGAYSWQVQGVNVYGDGAWSALLNFSL